MRPLPLNLELIRMRAADIRSELDRLRAYAAIPEAAFAGDPEKTRAARYGLIVVVEAAAAICTHLCARHGRAPDSYPGCFELLGQLAVIPPDLAARLSSMARLRNLLVHAYGRVDDSRVHAILRTHLGDLEAFLEQVGKAVAQELES
ncbi:MAG: DUF86 domain-containing protein [Armatimonadota bacterium]|nr:DUF86 domain-containing protein [Armatimonadota bacterium]MDR7410181.1 DUF86 domain-containing protein [Armatimonadota bacterium]